MKTKIVIVILAITFFPACEEEKADKRNIIVAPPSKLPTKEERMEYLLDSFQVRNLCDSAKWAIYCLNCDSIVHFTNKLKDSTDRTYAYLDLKLDTFSVRGDTTEFLFRYFYNGEKCDQYLVSDIFYRGVRYTNSPIPNYRTCYINRPIYFCPGDPHSRYLNMAHPKVIKYINKNAAKLNPWFRAEAQRRGLLKQ